MVHPISPAVYDITAIASGAVCGAVCRHHLGQVANRKIAQNPTKFSHLTGWHTAGINVLGSFVLGGVFGSPLVPEVTSSISNSPPAAKSAATASSGSRIPMFLGGGKGLTPRTKLLLGVGFCGSFTTFSTYSVDVVQMIAKNEIGKALSYVSVNNVGGVCAAALGMMLAKKIFAP